MKGQTMVQLGQETGALLDRLGVDRALWTEGAMPSVTPLTGEQLVEPHRARRINAIMMLCGHYDNSGEFAFRVGLPGKSGVGGGILCIAPGQGSIAVWSPGLNEAGTSLVGAIALEHFAYAAGWSVFDANFG